MYGLTPNQRRVLEAILALQSRGEVPTLRAIQGVCGFKRAHQAAPILGQLLDRGAILYDRSGPGYRRIIVCADARRVDCRKAVRTGETVDGIPIWTMPAEQEWK